MGLNGSISRSPKLLSISLSVSVCLSTNVLHAQPQDNGSETVGLGLAVLAIAITGRLLVAFSIAPLGLGFNLKGKLFVAIAWIPKGTVQVHAYVIQGYFSLFYSI